MKKFSIILLSLLCVPLLSGCSGEKITGTNAAKLLLAEERLDSESLKQSNIDFNKNVKKSNLNVKRRKSLTGTKVNKDGNKYTWTNFNEYSNMITYFDDFVKNIESTAKDAANLIETAKDRIESNDTWVELFLYDTLLNVSADEDVVMRRYKDTYQIINRGVDEQGAISYDVFSSNEGLQGGSRIRKVDDYRYEYSHDNGEEFQHFFIADKSRGYWIVQMPINDTSFSTTIIKDDMCYGYTTSIGSEDLFCLDIITADQKCDVVSINGSDFSFYTGAFTNIESMSIECSNEYVVNLEDYDYSGEEVYVLYEKATGNYSTTGVKSANLNLENGKSLKTGDTFANGNVVYNRGLINGTADGMSCSFSVEVLGDTLEEKIKNIELFIKETGLNFVRDYDDIINSIRTAFNDQKSSFKSISWNGYILDSLEVYAQARQKEVDKLPVFIDKYNSVKDNLSLSRYQQGSLDRNTSFPYVKNSSFNAEYKDKNVKINNASVTVDDFVLFEQGKNYNMQFALAQYDNNDGYSNLIPIEADNPTSVAYNGEESLTVSAEKLSFDLLIPQEGSYELVAYVADEDGIRVTRPQPVKFVTVEEDEISLHNYTARVIKSDEDFLNIISEPNENVTLELKDAKESYTYAELQKLLSAEAYLYGIPSSDNIEILNTDNSWSSLNGDELSLASGTYRLAFSNQDGKIVYVTTTY